MRGGLRACWLACLLGRLAQQMEVEKSPGESSMRKPVLEVQNHNQKQSNTTLPPKLPDRAEEQLSSVTHRVYDTAVHAKRVYGKGKR